MNKDKSQPRRQISENETRPRPSPRKRKDVTPFPKLLCCVCCKDGDSEEECQERTLGETIAEMRLAQRDRERQDHSSATSPSRTTQKPQISQGQNNKICYHKKVSSATTAHNGPSEVPSSQNSCKTTSDLEFVDARDYFSPSETENENEISPSKKVSRAEVTAKTSSKDPVKDMKGILKRCRCATCTGLMREMGNREPYQNSDVCDQRRNRKTVIKVDPHLKVVEYDIRSGEVHEERVEEVNLTGEHEPLGEMRNLDVVQSTNPCRMMVRGRLKNLFRASRYVEVDFDQVEELYEEDEEREVGEDNVEHDGFIADDEDSSLETLPLRNVSRQ